MNAPSDPSETIIYCQSWIGFEYKNDFWQIRNNKTILRNTYLKKKLHQVKAFKRKQAIFTYYSKLSVL